MEGAVTIQSYMDYLKIEDPRLITDLGIRNGIYNGKAIVEIPYRDINGSEIQTKIRLSLNKNEQRFAWKSHSDPMLYGLQLVPQMKGSTLIFVEGESDVHVATFHGINAVGVSGNTGFNPDMLDPSLDKFSSFYVLKEKQGGAKFSESFVGSKIADKCRVFDLGAIDDLRDLHIDVAADPKKFRTYIESQMELSTPLADAVTPGATNNTNDANNSDESFALFESLAPDKPKLPDPNPIIFNGLIGAIVKAIEPTTESGTMGLFASALGYFSHVVGRKPHIRLDYGTFVRANRFLLMIGKTSTGRKGTSNNNIKTFVREASHPFIDDDIYGNFGSGQGLVKKLAPQIPEDDEDFIPSTPSIMQVDEEFESTMTICKSQNSILTQILLNVFELAPVNRTTVQDEDMRANEYWFNMIGHITPNLLRKKLKADHDNVYRGFYNRFLFFVTSKSKSIYRYAPVNWIHNNQNLMELFKEQVQWASNLGQITLSPDAESKYIKFEQIASIDNDEDDESIVEIMEGRFPRHCLSLALLFYLFDPVKHPDIQASHVAQAVAVLDYVDGTIRWIFNSATGDPLADKLLSWFKSIGGSATKKEITNKVCGNHSPKIKLINGALDYLIKNNLIEEFEQPTKTKSARAFRIIHG